MRRHSRSSSESIDEVRTEVGIEQTAIRLAEGLERERLAGFLHGVDELLELGEHRLPINGAADVIDLPVDEIGAHLRVLGFGRGGDA